MAVDQPRKNRIRREIDYLRRIRHGDAPPDGFYRIMIDQDDDIFKHRARGRIDQPAGLDRFDNW